MRTVLPFLPHLASSIQAFQSHSLNLNIFHQRETQIRLEQSRPTLRKPAVFLIMSKSKPHRVMMLVRPKAATSRPLTCSLTQFDQNKEILSHLSVAIVAQVKSTIEVVVVDSTAFITKLREPARSSSHPGTKMMSITKQLCSIWTEASHSSSNWHLCTASKCLKNALTKTTHRR